MLISFFCPIVTRVCAGLGVLDLAVVVLQQVVTIQADAKHAVPIVRTREGLLDHTSLDIATVCCFMVVKLNDVGSERTMYRPST